MRISPLAFAGFVLAYVCWLVGLIVCLCAIDRQTIRDEHGLSISGAFILATLGVTASQLVTS